MLVEVELKKDNPVENVVKIWRWAHKSKIRTPILLVQTFSAHYLQRFGFVFDAKKVKQYERAVFIGNRMAGEKSVCIRYRQLPIYTTTRKGRPRQFTPLIRRGIVVKRAVARCSGRQRHSRLELQSCCPRTPTAKL